MHEIQEKYLNLTKMILDRPSLFFGREFPTVRELGTFAAGYHFGMMDFSKNENRKLLADNLTRIQHEFAQYIYLYYKNDDLYRTIARPFHYPEDIIENIFPSSLPQERFTIYKDRFLEFYKEKFKLRDLLK